MARLYLDEDLSREYVRLLQDHGHDVGYVVDLGTKERTDAWHLQQASLEGRVLVTFNERDYRFLHRVLTTLWVFQAFRGRHAGIITATAQLAPNAWVPHLSALFERESGLAGRMWVWHPASSEWKEDPWRPED